MELLPADLFFLRTLQARENDEEPVKNIQSINYITQILSENQLNLVNLSFTQSLLNRVVQTIEELSLYSAPTTFVTHKYDENDSKTNNIPATQMNFVKKANMFNLETLIWETLPLNLTKNNVYYNTLVNKNYFLYQNLVQNLAKISNLVSNIDALNQNLMLEDNKTDLSLHVNNFNRAYYNQVLFNVHKDYLTKDEIHNNYTDNLMNNQSDLFSSLYNNSPIIGFDINRVFNSNINSMMTEDLSLYTQNTSILPIYNDLSLSYFSQESKTAQDFYSCNLFKNNSAFASFRDIMLSTHKPYFVNNFHESNNKFNIKHDYFTLSESRVVRTIQEKLPSSVIESNNINNLYLNQYNKIISNTHKQPKDNPIIKHYFAKNIIDNIMTNIGKFTNNLEVNLHQYTSKQWKNENISRESKIFNFTQSQLAYHLINSKEKENNEIYIQNSEFKAIDYLNSNSSKREEKPTQTRFITQQILSNEQFFKFFLERVHPKHSIYERINNFAIMPTNVITSLAQHVFNPIKSQNYVGSSVPRLFFETDKINSKVNKDPMEIKINLFLAQEILEKVRKPMSYMEKLYFVDNSIINANKQEFTSLSHKINNIKNDSTDYSYLNNAEINFVEQLSKVNKSWNTRVFSYDVTSNELRHNIENINNQVKMQSVKWQRDSSIQTSQYLQSNDITIKNIAIHPLIAIKPIDSADLSQTNSLPYSPISLTFAPASLPIATNSQTTPEIVEDIEFIKKKVQKTTETTIQSTVPINTAIPASVTSKSQLSEQSITAIADKVYRVLERRLRSERTRKGLM